MGSDYSNLDGYRSEYLNGQDLGPTPQVVTIVAHWLDRVGDDPKEKVIVRFTELEKKLVLNKTQLLSFRDLHGDDGAAWLNKKVMLTGQKIAHGMYAGKWTILVDDPPNETPGEPVFVGFSGVEERV